jgi:hypothetical protein
MLGDFKETEVKLFNICHIGSHFIKIPGGGRQNYSNENIRTVAVYRLRVFENRVVRRIFRPKREEVAGGCRRVQNEELHNMYASPNIIRLIKSRIRWADHIARMGEIRNTFKILF